ncbi:radical SAM family heme chaperone HemW [Leadbettera azotonutricia]|uniref:Heme chaperone HemW n=1 Tax=Leadbettera azotonutricia (strain ATCC BAA-888 / DSM 13862 / ZAS-9) TaxID=545695 RepID=F5YCV6_LEAAZ|nr:radical SAM family heme chaperone HemW [Leadbettera azotonutricia]AEF80514.1 putative oxygen-independent coproporphyrinogen III oxidase [Leadbettera azotonutricia ZAS-9]
MEASLYVHVPFCAGCCDYCDFYSAPVLRQDKRLNLFIERLLEDAALLFRSFRVDCIPTVYIGGGTPSVLGAEGIKRLLDGLSGYWPGESRRDSPLEITVEANPESAGRDFLEACRDGGVTRVSLGVQSFSEKSRKAVHRVGEAGLLTGCLELVSEIYPRSFSADLIAGLPFQNEKILLDDIERLLSFNPGHVSLYSLTVEEGSALFDIVAQGEDIGLPPPDEADSLWIKGRDFLEQACFRQYEVSNFSLPGKESLHNIRYWRMENWLGLGPGASGTIFDDEGTARRYTVKADADAWLKRETSSEPPEVIEESLDSLTLMKESLLMGFRYVKGVDQPLFKKRFGKTLEEAIPHTLEKWNARGFLRQGSMALNSGGLLFLDRFLIDAFDEIDQ